MKRRQNSLIVQCLMCILLVAFFPTRVHGVRGRRSLETLQEMADSNQDMIGKGNTESDGMYEESLNDDDSAMASEIRSYEGREHPSHDIDKRTGEKKKSKKNKKKKDPKGDSKKAKNKKETSKKGKGKGKKKNHPSYSLTVSPTSTSVPTTFSPTFSPNSAPTTFSPTPSPNNSPDYHETETSADETGNSGDSDDESTDGELVTRTNSFGLQYEVASSNTPTKTHYMDLALLTSSFLDNHLGEYFADITDVYFIGFNIDKLRTPAPLTVEYESAAAYDNIGTIPTNKDIEDLISQAFQPSSPYLQKYMLLLKGFDQNNPFSKTTKVTLANTSDELSTPSKHGGGEGNSSGDSKKIAAVVAAVGGVMVILALLLYVKRSKANATRGGPPNFEGDPKSSSMDTDSGQETRSINSFTCTYAPQDTVFISDASRNGSSTCMSDGGVNTSENAMHAMREQDLASLDDVDLAKDPESEVQSTIQSSQDPVTYEGLTSAV